MKIPDSQNALVLRTDFSDEQAWKEIREAIEAPSDEFFFQANVEFVSDRAFADISAAEAISRMDPSSRWFFFIVDKTTLSDKDHPVLVVDLQEEPARAFRVIPSQMWAVENNLSLANMGFAEFADSVDADGIFRGFPS